MALIIEDGTGKADAQSYVTEAEFRIFAASRGVTLPTEPAAVEVLLVKAADYLLIFEGEYQGRRTFPGQALSFPRIGLTINCEPFPEDEIPSFIKQAQMQAGIEVSKLRGGELIPPTTKFPVYKERIEGAVERQYMTPRQLSTTPDGSAFVPTYPMIDTFLFPLLRGNECPDGESGAWLRTERK